VEGVGLGLSEDVLNRGATRVVDTLVSGHSDMDDVATDSSELHTPAMSTIGFVAG
jgi:hypothetical protein